MMQSAFEPAKQAETPFNIVSFPIPEITRISDCFKASLAQAESFDTPYRHWVLNKVLPEAVMNDVQSLSFPLSSVGDLSGKREYHNETRHYFDQDNIAKHQCVGAIAEAFQSSDMVQTVEQFFQIDIQGTFLRIEYAQDMTGFWLEPHTDLGVKRLTMLVYISDEDGHENMGTDVFNADKSWAKRSPFAPNVAMAFVPGDNTFHGFQKRDIPGVRKSLILNYVTKDWRDREQLCFPHQTVSS